MACSAPDAPTTDNVESLPDASGDLTLPSFRGMTTGEGIKTVIPAKAR